MVRSLGRSIPTVSRVGLVITATGVGFDVVHHVFAHDLHVANVLGLGFTGHVLTLAGMVVALLGVIRVAADSRRLARQKGERHAARRSAAAAR